MPGGMSLGWAAAVAVVLMPAAGLVALAQEDGAAQSETPADPPPAVADESAIPPAPPSFLMATTPQLACGVRVVPTQGAGFQTSGASSAIFTCWVAGAPPGDTSFSVHVDRIVDDAGGVRPIGQVCDQSPLVGGSGACRGLLTDPTGAPLIGGVLLSATLLPSGTRVGPINISPTLAGA